MDDPYDIFFEETISVAILRIQRELKASEAQRVFLAAQTRTARQAYGVARARADAWRLEGNDRRSAAAYRADKAAIATGSETESATEATLRECEKLQAEAQRLGLRLKACLGDPDTIELMSDDLTGHANLLRRRATWLAKKAAATAIQRAVYDANATLSFALAIALDQAVPSDLRSPPSIDSLRQPKDYQS